MQERRQEPLSTQRNVYGEPLKGCSERPLTGFFRTGCCHGTDTVTWDRLYFATIGSGTNEHVLAIAVEGRPRSAWIKVLPTAKTIIDALVVARKRG